jgi:hypothetical protein
MLKLPPDIQLHAHISDVPIAPLIESRSKWSAHPPPQHDWLVCYFGDYLPYVVFSGRAHSAARFPIIMPSSKMDARVLGMGLDSLAAASRHKIACCRPSEPTTIKIENPLTDRHVEHR